MNNTKQLWYFVFIIQQFEIYVLLVIYLITPCNKMIVIAKIMCLALWKWNCQLQNNSYSQTYRQTSRYLTQDNQMKSNETKQNGMECNVHLTANLLDSLVASYSAHAIWSSPRLWIAGCRIYCSSMMGCAVRTICTLNWFCSICSHKYHKMQLLLSHASFIILHS